jgi:predicted phage-related endonuclease
MKCDDDAISQLRGPVAFHKRILFWAMGICGAQFIKNLICSCDFKGLPDQIIRYIKNFIHGY